MSKSAASTDSALTRWLYRDAEWWQFWRPQSGPIGGMIAAMLVGGLALALIEAFT